ncbi:MAG: hypothetical protein KIT84_22835 [Labilithrix sp.]|nr:hypothetical protein [Labilithrix sp.]MCW5813882.1 hypothetical protein [Labilithrix sp.]
MRRFAVLALVGTCVGWAAVTSLEGCSAETPATPKKDAGRNASSSSGSGDDDDDNGGSTTSSSSSSSSSGGDAGNDAGPTTLSNPKKVTCGTKECDTTKDAEKLCCWPDSDEKKAACDDICEAEQGLELACDEKADCNDAGVGCCLTFNGSSCDEGTGCTEGPPLCKLDAECTGTDKCNLIDCKRGAVTIKIRTCTNGLAVPDGCETN